MREHVPMTNAQVTRGICMRRYAWGKRMKQISDESGVPLPPLRNVIMGAPFSEAVRARLEGYLRTPAGPAALMQNNDRARHPDAARFRILKRVFRARRLALVYGLPVCARDRLRAMTDGEIKVYFYNLSDRVKRHILSLDQSITRYWKFADDMEAWEFIERLDQLRANRQARNAARAQASQVREETRAPPPRPIL